MPYVSRGIEALEEAGLVFVNRKVSGSGARVGQEIDRQSPRLEVVLRWKGEE